MLRSVMVQRLKSKWLDSHPDLFFPTGLQALFPLFFLSPCAKGFCEGLTVSIIKRSHRVQGTVNGTDKKSRLGRGSNL